MIGRCVATMGLGLCLASAPAIADVGPGGEAGGAPKAKKTCRALTPTGSMMATRVCNTRAEWQRFDEANAQGTSDFRRATGMSSTNDRRN